MTSFPFLRVCHERRYTVTKEVDYEVVDTSGKYVVGVQAPGAKGHDQDT